MRVFRVECPNAVGTEDGCGCKNRGRCVALEEYLERIQKRPTGFPKRYTR